MTGEERTAEQGEGLITSVKSDLTRHIFIFYFLMFLSEFRVIESIIEDVVPSTFSLQTIARQWPFSRLICDSLQQTKAKFLVLS